MLENLKLHFKLEKKIYLYFIIFVMRNVIRKLILRLLPNTAMFNNVV